MFCPSCGNETSADAQFCHRCGKSLSTQAIAKPDTAVMPLSPASFRQGRPAAVVRPTVSMAPAQPMTTNAVRQGMTQARFNEENSNTMMGEIIIVAIAIGVVTSSWWGFGGALLGLFVAMSIRPLAHILIFVLSIGWGIAGYGIGALFDSQAASIVLALLAFSGGLGVHFSAMQWFRDV